MPGFNFSFNINFGSTTKKAEETKSSLSDEECKAQNVKYKLIASIGMCAELAIAVYLLIGLIVYLPSRKTFYSVITLIYTPLFIVGPLLGLLGLFADSAKLVGVFRRLQQLHLLAALPIFIFSLLMVNDPYRWSRHWSCYWGCSDYMVFVGVHGLVASVLGAPIALCLVYVVKKIEKELRQPVNYTPFVNNVPPSCETSATTLKEEMKNAVKSLLVEAPKSEIA